MKTSSVTVSSGDVVEDLGQEEKASLRLEGGMAGLFRLVSTRPWSLGSACFASAMGTTFGLFPYVAVFWIAQEVLSRSPDTQLIWWYASLGLFATLLKFVLLVISHSLAHAGAFGILYDLRILLARKLGTVPLGFFQHKQANSIQKAMVDDVGSLEAFLAHMLPDAAAAFTVPLVAFVFMLWVDWRMALASLLALPFAIVAQVATLGKQGQDSYERYHNSIESTKRAVLEYLRGIHVVKAFGMDAKSFGELSAAIKQMTDYVEDYAKNSAPPFVMTMKLVSGGSNALFLVPVGAWLFVQGQLDMPTFLFFLLVGTQVLSPFLRISNALGNLQLLMRGADNIQSILSYPSLPESRESAPLGHDVVFEGVSFSYDKTKVLDNISLCIPEGSVTALVGPSGAGKTTILRLISRFWDCNDGLIRVGGKDIRRVDVDEHLSRLSLVFQETFLFQGTVRENLLLARADASEDALIRACQLAQIHDVIVSLPNGYETELGERGARLSGGEKQRLSIARAILKDAPILLLDEATAFADPSNEAKLQLALNEATVGKTLIIVAHRLSTIRHADQIIVMDKGGVVDQGLHEALIERCSLYRTLWENYDKAAQWSFQAHEEVGQ